MCRIRNRETLAHVQLNMKPSGGFHIVGVFKSTIDGEEHTYMRELINEADLMAAAKVYEESRKGANTLPKKVATKKAGSGMKPKPGMKPKCAPIRPDDYRP